MNENPLLAPDAKEKLTNILEEALHDFKFRLKRSIREVVEQILEDEDSNDTNAIDVELNSDTFNLDDFVSAYVENEAPSTKVVIKFFEGNRKVNDANVTITLDSNYWDEDELELCTFRLTADLKK